MTGIKKDVKETMEKAKDIAHDVEYEIETVAHNTIHPEDETDAEARKRQPFMPIIGAALIAIILIICLVVFYK
jgi:hypothetical protein